MLEASEIMLPQEILGKGLGPKWGGSCERSKSLFWQKTLVKGCESKYKSFFLSLFLPDTEHHFWNHLSFLTRKRDKWTCVERPCPQIPGPQPISVLGAESSTQTCQFWAITPISDSTPFYKARVYTSHFFSLLFKTMFRVHIVTNNKSLKEIRNFFKQCRPSVKKWLLIVIFATF